MSPYSWRGLCLDLARSFFPPLVLRDIIVRMADLGLNRLHLHLTDDQGWRIEIPGRPELTDISGRTAIRGGNPGWLTVADWERLAEFGERRGVVLVPEIDLPGHITAALHATPALTGGRPIAAHDADRIAPAGLDAALPATGEFLRDVLGKVAAMTSGDWIHIGGDECLALSPEDYRELITLAVGIVEEAGKRPVAWQEAALAGLGDRLILQLWALGSASPEDARPAAMAHLMGAQWAALAASDPLTGLFDRTIAALLREAGRGAGIIMSPAPWTYLDMRSSPDGPGQDWAGVLTVERAGDWDPATVLPGLDPARILGVEAALWTEMVHTEAEFYDRLFPRLDVFAGVALCDRAGAASPRTP